MNDKKFFIIVTYEYEKIHIDNLISRLLRTELKIIQNTTESNLGYGGGANAAIGEGLKKNFDWFVVMNQDIKITKQAVTEFEKKLDKTESGIAGPFTGRLDPKRWSTMLEKEEKTGSPIEAPGMTGWDGFRTSQSDKDHYLGLLRRQNGVAMTQLDYISGAFMAVHRKVFEKIGLFYTSYFVYYEDADLCIRAQRAGFPLTEIKIEGITHEESMSLGKGSFKHEYYLARNHLLFIERNAPVDVKLHEALRMPKTLWVHYRNKNWGALTGIRDYALRRFGEYKSGFPSAQE